MLNITEKYAKDHKIGFSTNPNPDKSKTKGILFSKNEMKWSPVPLQLSGNNLPWVKSGKYLGSKMTNIMDGFSQEKEYKGLTIMRGIVIFFKNFLLPIPS